MEGDRMRKIWFFVLWLMGASFAYSQANEKTMARESWMDVGLGWEYDFYNLNADTAFPGELIPASLIGGNVKWYGFGKDKAIGGFICLGVLMQLPINEQPFHYPANQLDVNFGIAFRLRLIDTVYFFSGIGVNYNYSMSTFEWYRAPVNSADRQFDRIATVLKVGVCMDLGLKIDIKEKFYLSLGGMVFYDYVMEKTLRIAYAYDISDESVIYGKGENSYGLLRIRPYLSFGVNFWSVTKRRGGIGKMK
jgi:hypothetical protein